MWSLAKIRLDDLGVAADARRIALCDDAALGEHQDAVAQRHDEFHVVLDHHESRAELAVDRLEPDHVRQARECEHVAIESIDRRRTGRCGRDQKSGSQSFSRSEIS